MKKLFIVLFTLTLITGLSACGRTQDAVLVENVPLTKAEQKIANLTSDIINKFTLKKGNIYDISIYLFTDGESESLGGIYGVDPKDGGGTVYISGSREGNAGFMWGISCDSAVARFPAPKFDDGRTLTVLNGTGKDRISMEKNGEYVLVYAALKEGNSISASAADVFYTWDMFEDKSELTSKFDYAYVVTVRLSDLPGNG